MNRRQFIEASLATAAISSLPMNPFSEVHKLDRIGVELYTVRDAMKADFAGTLAKVASLGYKEVEFSGYFDHSPKDIRALLDKNGLTSPACHVDYNTVQNKWPQAIEAAHTIGHQFVVCPWIDESQRQSADGYKRAVELFNKAGAESKKAGVQFAYHNHFWEFEPDAHLGGKMPYDYMLEAGDKENFEMELDLCWISVAGQDPVAYFERYPGRFPLVHVKDMKKLPHLAPDKLASLKTDDIIPNMSEVGSGEIDWKRIFSHLDKSGTQHFFVEHDKPKDPFASLTASYDYLSKLRF